MCKENQLTKKNYNYENQELILLVACIAIGICSV